MNVQNILALSVADRLQMLEQIWTSLTPSEIPLPDWQKEELDRRIVEMDKGDVTYRTWQQIKSERGLK
jgi:putative addiction module component (TIGR02574 family)